MFNGRVFSSFHRREFFHIEFLVRKTLSMQRKILVMNWTINKCQSNGKLWTRYIYRIDFNFRLHRILMCTKYIHFLKVLILLFNKQIFARKIENVNSPWQWQRILMINRKLNNANFFYVKFGTIVHLYSARKFDVHFASWWVCCCLVMEVKEAIC